MRPALVLGPVTLLVTAPAAASEVVFRPVSLEQVIRRSSHVLVARRLKPPAVIERIDITPRGAKPDPRRYPPYPRVVHRFQVVRVLREPRGAKPLKQIEVVGANETTDLRLHRMYYVEKGSKSPIYDAYRSATSEKAATASLVILFLAPTSDRARLRYTVQSSAEPVSAEARVRKALAAAAAP